jgi:hypothetical protein
VVEAAVQAAVALVEGLEVTVGAYGPLKEAVVG